MDVDGCESSLGAIDAASSVGELVGDSDRARNDAVEVESIDGRFFRPPVIALSRLPPPPPPIGEAELPRSRPLRRRWRVGCSAVAPSVLGGRQPSCAMPASQMSSGHLSTLLSVSSR